MMVFRRKSKRIYECKVTTRTGRSAVLSTGTRDRETAQGVERLVQTYRGKRRWNVLDMLVDKKLSLPALYDASQISEIAADALIDAALTQAKVVDLRPYLPKFLAARLKVAGRGKVVAPEYVKMVNTLYPKTEPFTSENFTADEIRRRIAALPHAAATKTRYLAGAKQVSRWLLEEKVITSDPARDVRGWGMSEPRESYHDAADARRLIEALPQPYRGAESYLYACAAEQSAFARVRAREFELDGDPPQAFVPGTKNRWRRRWVPIVEELEWTIPHIRAWLKDKHPDALASDGVSWQQMLLVHQDQCRAVGLKVTTLHDWRHTHAVALLKWGYDEQIVASHEGHKDTARVRDTYGRWVPARGDYARRRPRGKVTNGVTAINDDMKLRGVK